MADEQSSGVSSDLLTDTEDTNRFLDDTESLSDTDPEPSLPSFDSLSPLSDSEADVCSPVETPCDYTTHHSLAAVGRTPPSQLFQLRGTSSTFSSRSQNIFSGLEHAMKREPSSPGNEDTTDGEFTRPLTPEPQRKVIGECLAGNRITSNQTRPTRQGSGSQQARTLPDYLVHPERWTRYSLEDVAETSNKKNTAVALELMESLKRQRESSIVSPALSHAQAERAASKILFSKPASVGGSPPAERERTAGRTEAGRQPSALRKRPHRAELEPREAGQVGLTHLQSGEADEGKVGEAGRGGQQVAKGETFREPAAFHSAKKRNRKNIRIKTAENDEEN
ncbi:protein TSSC4 [Callorhinchus milii]|uniref:U5 small nuclear ribonucleoprotein TSSC4 n=1 Tax=Callorhinchus milii TaxID=7868 RepID=V9KTZ3_CALMI|nr:protein TSSC4 [Callorhinchus milii]XP_007885580.1 protein TSSC4 [Callorhinchus milii]XP_007885581.1 protein TSSC4 [Callorhinchus milii]XP_042197442.1 protein TSSC4 [Callorhinchus milii]XP_042197443.1 protein TSSC4 [Callorhinchus milii]|eukprot:gi/632940898/ref/XP_007885579.1/ PREDICTED: protein TSSC4 [Callorhinchus milii]